MIPTDELDRGPPPCLNRDSYGEMLAAVQAFHDKHRFKETGGEEMI